MIDYIDCGIFRNEFVVSVGMSYNEIVNYIKKHKFDKRFIKWQVEEKENFIMNIENAPAFTLFNKKYAFGIVWFKTWKNNWENYECLLHEVSHIVDFVSCQKNFEYESEARAYLTEYLFHEIRVKLIKGK